MCVVVRVLKHTDHQWSALRDYRRRYPRNRCVEPVRGGPGCRGPKRSRMRARRRRQYKRAKFRKNQNGFSHTRTRPKR